MKNTKSIALEQGVLSRIRIRATLIALVGGVATPFLAHMLPAYNGTPVGAILLAMFYAPLVAVLVSRFHVGLIVAALAPLLNVLITGHPDWSIAPVLTIELILFVSFVYFLSRQKAIGWLSAPVAYIAAKTVSTAAIAVFPAILNVNPADFWLNSIVNGSAGLAVLTAINIAALKLRS